MKTTSWINSLGLAIAFALLAFGLTGCQSPVTSSDNHPAFTCPMHPEVLQAAAGTCPKCGMKLETKPGNH